MATDRISEIVTDVETIARKAGRDPSSVKIIAVTKMFPASVVREAHRKGIRDFAENYLQEAISKQDESGDLDVRWHFIGRVQSNKIKTLAGRFHMIHGVDKFETAEKLSLYATTPEKILLQVNAARERTKAGVDPADLQPLIEKISALKNVEIHGLMFMAPYDESKEKQKRFYASAREIFEKAAAQYGSGKNFRELSMGTSHDYGTAIEFGATMVRLGTALFGERS